MVEDGLGRCICLMLPFIFVWFDSMARICSELGWVTELQNYQRCKFLQLLCRISRCSLFLATWQRLPNMYFRFPAKCTFPNDTENSQIIDSKVCIGYSAFILILLSHFSNVFQVLHLKFRTECQTTLFLRAKRLFYRHFRAMSTVIFKLLNTT